MIRTLGRWIGIASLCGVILLSVVWQGASQAFEDIDGSSGFYLYSLSRGDHFKDRDCPDFESQNEAQRFFISHGGPDRDRHHLDVDPHDLDAPPIPDGKACDDFDYY